MAKSQANSKIAWDGRSRFRAGPPSILISRHDPPLQKLADTLYMGYSNPVGNAGGSTYPHVFTLNKTSSIIGSTSFQLVPHLFFFVICTSVTVLVWPNPRAVAFPFARHILAGKIAGSPGHTYTAHTCAWALIDLFSKTQS